MNFDDLINAHKNTEICKELNEHHLKLLSPSPLKEAEELETVISSRFRYTGPGKWVKIIRDYTKNV